MKQYDNAEHMTNKIADMSRRPAQPEQKSVALDVTIDDEEALALLRDMVVQSTGDLTSIRIFGGGHSGDGLYVASAEYPEEGAILLVSTTPLQPKEPKHPDDTAVDKFAAAMKAKMTKQRAKGYSGWDDKTQCSTERLQQMLFDHVSKGDPVDVGNFAMMLWSRDEATAPPKGQAQACCAECGKKESHGFALYCVECMDKINAQTEFATTEELSIHAGFDKKAPGKKPVHHRGTSARAQPATEVEKNTMELAESVGLIGPAPSGEGCECGFKKAVAVDWDVVQEVLDGVWRREMSADDGFDQLNELISTTTPQSKPLMAEQINSIWKEYREILGGWDYGGTEVITESLFENSVRAIEAAHGIGGDE
jgi:hypothetical protein